MPAVRQLRLVITAADYDRAVRFYRDVLGMAELANYDSERGRAVLLDAGAGTIEIGDEGHVAYVDELEVGRRVAPAVRVALQVDDTAATTEALLGAGAALVAPPTATPWGSRNSRLDGPAGLQLTLFDDPA